jgi:hypothetical protein
MGKTGTTRKSKKQQALDAELGLIIDEMGRAMWAANRDYIARSTNPHELTFNMTLALHKFKYFCEDHYGK